MALFAAYAEEAQKHQENQGTSEKPEWLENSSFQPNFPSVSKENVEVDSETDSEKEHQHNYKGEPIEKVSTTKRLKKHKKKKGHKIKKAKVDLDPDDRPDISHNFNEDGYMVDKEQTREFLKVNTISRPAVSKYRITYWLSNNPRPKKKRFKRYFMALRLSKSDEKHNKSGSEDADGPKLTRDNIDKAGFHKRDEHFTGFTQEEELSKMTEHYNKNLGGNPTDIQMWLKYVDFQDTIYEFEKSYRKGSIAKAQRVLAERKISILEKALMSNPGCKQLLRERLKVAVTAFPADELQYQLKKLVDKDKDNIILWQGYIEATQCSMSHCNGPAVLGLYGKCLSILHQLRRTALSEKVVFEESILSILYQCGLFLKQAGLFEQLWTLLKLYLELNLSPTDKSRFNVERYINESDLLELEEVVLGSQLPHHELWLRTEKLRESCHYLPFAGEGDCEDPQRLVFSEDVVELIQPITTPENIFKLVAITLSLLKIPLLPCRHSTMEDLGLDYVPWSLDSIESLLPIFIDQYPIDLTNKFMLRDINRYAVGPQYLKVIPGQEQYLNFVLATMESCADCLKEQDQISVRVWWFRFQRLLILLDAQERFKLPPHFKKKIKTNIKDLLKREQHRNNEILYIEYAYIEKALGNQSNYQTVLKTALGMNKNKSLVFQNWSEAQANQCLLYKSLVEACIYENSSCKAAVLPLLVKLVLQRDFESLTNGLLMEAETRFRNFTDELLEHGLSDVRPVGHFLPEFFTDWVICHGWFLFWLKGPLHCGTFLENILSKLEENHDGLTFQKEVLYEFYCTILFKYCVDNPGSGVFKILDEVLFRAIEKFPNNLYLLAILAKEQSISKTSGVGAWKVQNLLLKTGRSIPTIFTVIINDLIKLEIEEEICDTVTDLFVDDWLNIMRDADEQIDNYNPNDDPVLFSNIGGCCVLPRREHLDQQHGVLNIWINILVSTLLIGTSLTN